MKRYPWQDGWGSYRGRGKPSEFARLEDWLAAWFRRRRGNAAVERRIHLVRFSFQWLLLAKRHFFDVQQPFSNASRVWSRDAGSFLCPQ